MIEERSTKTTTVSFADNRVKIEREMTDGTKFVDLYDATQAIAIGTVLLEHGRILLLTQKRDS